MSENGLYVTYAPNMRGVFLTCQAAARSMKAGARAGKIITISSGAYASGRVGASRYCASKAGVVMFTRVLEMELAAPRAQQLTVGTLIAEEVGGRRDGHEVLGPASPRAEEP